VWEKARSQPDAQEPVRRSRRDSRSNYWLGYYCRFLSYSLFSSGLLYCCFFDCGLLGGDCLFSCGFLATAFLAAGFFTAAFLTGGFLAADCPF